jgi:hypothetical protein
MQSRRNSGATLLWRLLFASSMHYQRNSSAIGGSELDKAQEVARIEREATEVRLSPAKLCERAGVAASTWWRNRKDPETITLDTMDKLEAAIRSKRQEMTPA